ncbi:class 3 adenylate cyclase/TolB-like protein [Hydrogenophaga palleronii]|uniref:Class 3 adenylate cyclase/TolB-like protein n=1 Tax=Hydrogenophaga palleronii TaxID=65655 RepID=A0ABU1WHB0_9BURK|nr:adenylate/guanylate cyclase domain-containing protein [Hydrogenophaga palleronii]MDR7148654.1 class 3 adenylate cyclase/TolB-like protein [Hydrogenophaga palleronii]
MQLQGSSVDAPLDGALPLQQHKVVLVVDLVESVRLMASNEAAVVERWQGFMRFASKCVPEHRGRLVKSLGDGLLAEFDEAADAVQTAMALHSHFIPVNKSLHPNEQLHLRAGINASQLYVGEHDVYGHGVNLAARVASLAEPGDIVVTASVRDGIVDGVDGEVEDMGESYLKHWPEPVRTWRVHPVRAGQVLWRPEPREAAATDFRPSIAVIPFEARNPSPEHFVIGELIADGVIAQLSRSQDLRVISRLSTTAFRGRRASASEIDGRLDAAFVLSGSYATLGGKVVIMAELADTRRNEVVWAERLSGDTMDLMEVQSEMLGSLCTACAHALLNSEVQRSLVLPLPKLDSNALMLGGITLMHRSTPRDLQRSHQLLEAVAERHKRVAAPWAWLAKWHIMQVVQGLSGEPARDFHRAIATANRALDLEPNSSLALAIKGHALCHLGEDVATSRQLLLEAAQGNPNDPMAWLYNSVWSQMWGNAEDSVVEAENALRLSPLDPQKYYFEMMLAASYVALERWEEVVELCKSSLKKNRYHLPTIRSLMTAQHELGEKAEARKTFEIMLTLQSNLTIDKYLSSGGESALRRRVAKVMESLGLPKN